MAPGEMAVVVPVEKAIHNAAAEMARALWADYGIRVSSLNFTWEEDIETEKVTGLHTVRVVMETDARVETEPDTKVEPPEFDTVLRR